MTRTAWLPDTGWTLIPETAIGEADRLAEEAALDLLDTVRPSPWVPEHRTPGFTADDQSAGTRGKKKSRKAQLTQRAANRKRAAAITQHSRADKAEADAAELAELLWDTPDDLTLPGSRDWLKRRGKALAVRDGLVKQ